MYLNKIIKTHADLQINGVYNLRLVLCKMLLHFVYLDVQLMYIATESESCVHEGK